MIAVDGALMSETLYGPLSAGAAGRLAVLDQPGARAALLLGALIGARRADALRGAAVRAVARAGRWRGAAERAGAPASPALATLGVRARRRAVDDPQRRRASTRFVPISTNDSTVARRRELPADLPRDRPRRLEHRAASPSAATTTRRARPRSGGARRLDYARDHVGRAAGRGRRAPAARLGPLAAAAAGDVRRGPPAARRAGRASPSTSPAVAARRSAARVRCAAAGATAAGAAGAGGGRLRGRGRSATACRACATASRSRCSSLAAAGLAAASVGARRAA